MLFPTTSLVQGTYLVKVVTSQGIVVKKEVNNILKRVILQRHSFFLLFQSYLFLKFASYFIIETPNFHKFFLQS